MDLCPAWGPGGTWLGAHRPGKSPGSVAGLAVPDGPGACWPPGGRARLLSVTGFGFPGSHQAGSSVPSVGARLGCPAACVCGHLVAALTHGRLNQTWSYLGDGLAGWPLLTPSLSSGIWHVRPWYPR